MKRDFRLVAKCHISYLLVYSTANATLTTARGALRQLHSKVNDMWNRKTLSVLGAITIGVGLGVSAAAPASALGTRSAVCDNRTYRTFAAVSNTARAYTQESPGTAGSGYCGDSKVRASYKLYSGSPVYWTSWKTGSDFAEQKPGNIMVGGEHQVTSATWGSTYRLAT